MENVTDYDVRSAVVNSVREVFDLMLSMEIDYLEAVSQSYLYGKRILASINLVGPVTGRVTIQVSDKFSRIMAGTMLDTNPGDITDPGEVKDVITEVCNMISGNLKSGLCDAGLSCELSVPTLTSGKDYKLDTMHATRQEFFTFFQGEETILVEVALKERGEEQLVDSSENVISPIQPDNGLSGFDIESSISSAVMEVFDMMLDMDISHCDLTHIQNTEGNRLSVSISLSGDILGWLNIQLSELFSRSIAASMLDMEPDDLDDPEEVKDVIGEVCNMISGNLKSALCDSGFACSISPPSFTAGCDFEMECLHLDREEKHAFSHGNDTFVVEIGLKTAK